MNENEQSLAAFVARAKQRMIDAAPPDDPAERAAWAKERQAERALDRSSAKIKQNLAGTQDDQADDTTADDTGMSPLERLMADQDTPEARQGAAEADRSIRQSDRRSAQTQRAKQRRGLSSPPEEEQPDFASAPQQQAAQGNDQVAAAILAEIKTLAKGQADIMQRLDAMQQQKQVATWGP